MPRTNNHTLWTEQELDLKYWTEDLSIGQKYVTRGQVSL